MQQAVTRHPLLVDAGLASLLAAPLVAHNLLHRGHHFGPSGSGLGEAVSIFALLFGVTVRRTWPMQVLIAATVTASGVAIATGRNHPAFAVLIPIATYTTASRTRRVPAWLVAAASVLLFAAGNVLRFQLSWWAPENLGVLAWTGMATAFGDATRSRRAYVAGVEERARRAEQTREEEARRRVVEERIRIARELHDVVSHHIAVINVQAGAASHVLQHQPEAVGPALAHIRHASDTVLKELAAVVSVLRQSDDLASTEPTRGLARLDGLIEALTATGLEVEYRQVGDPRALPAVVDLAAFRIIQEALTNAHKYGTGTVRCAVTYTSGNVILDITNPIASGAAASGTGYGIVGMRERAAAAGGTVVSQTGPDGWFTVHAVLPARDAKVGR